jgi:ribosomal protein S18 acetylase RimI-like enzyme
MSVRRAVAADAAGLSELAAATFALACPPGTTQEAVDDFVAKHLTERNFSEYLSDPERELFIAEIDGAAAGYTMVIHSAPSDPDVVAALPSAPSSELSKVYVREDFHGAGIASALVDACIDAARARGAEVLWLGVNKHNARANRFYEKSGFRVAGSKKFLVGDNWEDDFVRMLVLTPGPT